jgi:cobalt-precorrin-5B (C1)-methyltransferase
MVDTEIFVPRGEELARQTLNGRLGITGGISILGTSGIVRPLSHAAYLATVKAALSVARASGLNHVVLTTGRRSERYAQALWPQIPEEGFVQIGDYFAKSLEMAAEQGFEQVILAVFFGKAVKMAQGIPHTHARSARLALEKLGHWAMDLTGSKTLAQRVVRANTARHVFEMIKDDHPALIEKVGREAMHAAFAFGRETFSVGMVLFDFEGDVRFQSLP